jgi:hypothetical protein
MNGGGIGPTGGSGLGPSDSNEGALCYSGELFETLGGLAPPEGQASHRPAQASRRRARDECRRPAQGRRVRHPLPDLIPARRIVKTREAIHGSSTAFAPMWIIARRECAGFVLSASRVAGRAAVRHPCRSREQSVTPSRPLRVFRATTRVIIERQLCERSVLSPMSGEQRGLRFCPLGVVPGWS